MEEISIEYYIEQEKLPDLCVKWGEAFKGADVFVLLETYYSVRKGQFPNRFKE